MLLGRTPSVSPSSTTSPRPQTLSTPFDASGLPLGPPGSKTRCSAFVSTTRSAPTLLGCIPSHSAPLTTFRRSRSTSSSPDSVWSPVGSPGPVSRHSALVSTTRLSSTSLACSPSYSTSSTTVWPLQSTSSTLDVSCRSLRPLRALPLLGELVSSARWF